MFDKRCPKGQKLFKRLRKCPSCMHSKYKQNAIPFNLMQFGHCCIVKMTNALQQDSFLAQASFIAFGKGVQLVSEHTFAETGHFFRTGVSSG